jgi:hypothetical protein
MCRQLCPVNASPQSCQLGFPLPFVLVLLLVLVIAAESSTKHDDEKCLPRNIGLAEKLEPLAEEHGRCAVRVVNVQRQRREPARMR